MSIENNIIKENWERQWTVFPAVNCVQHETGLAVQFRQDDAGHWCAHAPNSAAWALGDPARNQLLPTLLLQAEAIFELSARKPSEPVPPK